MQVADLGGGAIQLTWDASTDNVGMQSYLIYRNGGYLGWVPDGTLTYDDSGLTEGLTYAYELRAVDLADNQSAKSTAVSISPGGPDTEIPSTPANVQATDLGGGTVQITWDASTDNVGVGSYLVYRNGAYIGWTDSATLTYDDAGLSNGLTYSFEIRAVDLAGNRSPKSTPTTITVGP